VSTPAPGGPTARRILVGGELRRLREANQISRETAGYRIRASVSKISRMELGRVGFKERDIGDLLELYGVQDAAQREALTALAREANSQGWWHSFDDVLPNWFQTYVGLEEAANQIRCYEIQFFPGLLQSDEYARAVITAAAGAEEISATELDRRVNLRAARQAVLHRPNPPHFVAVIDEATLHRQIGGPEVLRRQMQFLLDLARLPNVTVQVMPFRFGGHAGEGGAFSLLGFPDPDLGDMVYVEQLGSAYYLDKPDYVQRYARTMDRLVADSLSPADSSRLLEQLLARG
jgi:transcriptional regulator with XRE-family HTH domain